MKKPLFLIAGLLVLSALTIAAQAQGGPVCSVNTDMQTPDCSSLAWLTGLTCKHKTVTCPQVGNVTLAPLGITYGYKTPTGQPNGTIVILTGAGGIIPEAFPGAEKVYATDYYNAGFQIVMVAWDSDWEDTGTATKNIAYAAGRPAAFLRYIKTSLYDPLHQLNPKAGMCAQGTSAGSAEIAYSLAWYGAGTGTTSYLDKAEFLSGPPISDIEKGCKVAPNIQSVTVCPSGQFGCNPANVPASWTVGAGYTDALSGVRSWTGDSSGDSATCQRPSGYTSGSANQAWKAMSIVDGTVATYNYPKTNISAWLCANVSSPDGLNDGLMNNSSSQGQLFYQNIADASQIGPFYQINAVQACAGTEGVTQGIPPQTIYSTGMQAIEHDMEDPINGCLARH